jgi:hypothetical protein
MPTAIPIRGLERQSGESSKNSGPWDVCLSAPLVCNRRERKLRGIVRKPIGSTSFPLGEKE